jgi:hypothetical protein
MRKLIAGFMTTLMTLMTIASPVLAAGLGDYPGVLKAADGTLNALVVVGSDAAVGDVVGAIDVASRLAETGKTSVSVSCPGASGSVTGTEKDTVSLNGALSSVFPASGVLKTAHFSGLVDSTYSWRGTDYDFREQVNLAGVAMSHDLATSNVNGTEKMIVESSDLKYQYVFDKALTGTGSTSDPNYTYPIYVTMLGKSFAIVGTGSNQVKMLQGSIGTATATTPVKYNDYSVYADLGSDNSWTRVIIKDASGNTVDTLTITRGDNKQSTATGLTVQVTAVRALQDGTVVGADVVVGPTTAGTTKTYDVTADVTSTGTSSDVFPGETVWGVQVGTNTLTAVTSFATTGGIDAGDVIEVVYKPSSTQYLVAGSKVSLPNNYGDLEYVGWNTEQFATITVAPLSGTVSAYNNSADTQALGNLGGIEISTDVAGSIVSTANTGFSKAYILWNYSRAADRDVAFIGFYDTSKQKIIVNGTIDGVDTESLGEYRSKVFNVSNSTGDAHTVLKYPFKLSYGNAGDNDWYLNVTIGRGKLIYSMGVGTTANTITLGFRNKSAATTSQAPEFKLGVTDASSEVDEVNATTHGTVREAGRKSQEIVDDSGILLQNTDTYGASDKVVFKIPFKTLYAKVSFGKRGSAVSGSTVSYTSYPAVPITSAIARLDTELTAADKLKHLIAIGGSGVNSVTAEALGLSYPTYGTAGGVPENKGLIKMVTSPYDATKYVIIVAGWEVENTRAAASALQLYDTKLAGQTASAVEVTGTVGAPTVTAV